MKTTVNGKTKIYTEEKPLLTVHYSITIETPHDIRINPVLMAYPDGEAYINYHHLGLVDIKGRNSSTLIDEIAASAVNYSLSTKIFNDIEINGKRYNKIRWLDQLIDEHKCR